jgi:hypothetical protein
VSQAGLPASLKLIRASFDGKAFGLRCACRRPRANVVLVVRNGLGKTMFA